MENVIKKTIEKDFRYGEISGRCESCSIFTKLHHIEIIYYKDNGQSYTAHIVCEDCYKDELEEILLYNKKRKSITK